jgi:hypothetical protein
VDGTRFQFSAPADDESKALARDKPSDKRDTKPLLPETFVGPPSLLDQQTEIESDRKPALRTNGNLLLRNATLLTVTNGTMREADRAVVGDRHTPFDRCTAPHGLAAPGKGGGEGLTIELGCAWQDAGDGAHGY